MIKHHPRHRLGHLFDVEGSLFLEITPRVLMCVAIGVAVVDVDRHVHPVAIPTTALSAKIAGTLLALARHHAEVDAHHVETDEMIKIGGGGNELAANRW